MIYNKHSDLEGLHAFLSASSYHWLNYSETKLVDRYNTRMATLKGTELHEFASQCIKLGQKLPRSKKTLNSFVNDAIGFRMKSEQILYHSINCFGTADAIVFDETKKVLRIHDLKTGITPAHFEQLMIYAALFCLEYKEQPEELIMELRLYQNDEVEIYEPTADEIRDIMDTIIRFDKVLTDIQKEEILYG